MYRYSVHDQLLKNKIFALCFEELTFRRILMDKKARILEVISLICSGFLLIAFFSYVLLSFFNRTDLDLFYFLVMTLFALSAICSGLASVWLSKKHIRLKYPELAFLIKRNPFLYSTSILFSVRCDNLYELLKSERIKYDNVDNLMRYFEKSGESIQKKRWLPIATFATFIFPFWSILVKTLWDSQMIIELIILTFLLPACVLIWRYNFQTLLLSKSQQYYQLSQIFDTVKNFPKF